MEEFSTGTDPRVPAVKPDKPSPVEEALSLFEASAAVSEEAGVDKDLLCPICMQIIKDAFLTSCGHSFCYMCIITHLRNKSDCPCCSQFLTNNQLFPNFLLDKLLKKTSARQISKTASPVEQFRQVLQQVLNEPSDVHCPVVEISTRSKLSCLSWNKQWKNHIASSDYEGIVTMWDVTTRQSLTEYEEHEKRAWSVDFSRTDPSMLVSGSSDDCKVKVWCTKQEARVLNIDMKENICCVKYNPGSSNYIAVGSADHHIHYDDLRNISSPLHVLSGHKKAVSHVKFLSENELASASTDSTLRLWDVK